MADIKLTQQFPAAPDLSVGRDTDGNDIWLRQQFPAPADLSFHPVQLPFPLGPQELAPAPPFRTAYWVSEQDVSALGAAIGAVLVWTASAIFAPPPAAQPQLNAADQRYGSHEAGVKQEAQAVYKWGTDASQIPSAAAAQPNIPWVSIVPQVVEPEQPWFSKQFFPPAVADTPKAKWNFTAPQESTEQAQPWFARQQTAQRPVIRQAVYLQPETIEPTQPVIQKSWRLFFDNPPLKHAYWIEGQQDPTQDQPWTVHQPPGSAVAEVPPLGPSKWIVPQADPTQDQPWVVRQPPTPVVVVPPLGPSKWIVPQLDPSQPQPIFWRQQLSTVEVPTPRWYGVEPQQDLNQPQPWFTHPQTAQAPVIRPIWWAVPQVDEDQPQPWHTSHPPASFVAQTPPLRPWYWIFQQADPSQEQPWAAHQPPESQAPPPPPDIGSGGMGGGGGKWQEGLWEQIELEMEELVSFAPPKDPAILPVVDAVKLAGTIKGLKGTLHLKKGLLPPPPPEADDDDDTAIRLLLLS